MKPPNHQPRINLAEMKAQIVKKLGIEGSKQYFYHLNRFLSSKSNKAEFDKLCLKILGRENIPLHNQLIRSILRNASTAKAPPLTSQKNDALKHATEVSGKEILSDSYLQNGFHAGATHAFGSQGLSNGVVILPPSPKSAAADFQKIGTTQPNDYNAVLENGHLNPPDIGILVPHPAKISVPRISSKDQIEAVARNNGKNALSRSPVQAPLGVPFCPASIGGAIRALPPMSSSKCISSSCEFDLQDTHSVRERMEQIALAQGLEGVSMDCANLLNRSLDSYIKGLIRSCIEITGARSGHELINNKQQAQTKLINGFKPGHQYQMQNTGLQEQRAHCPVSLQDFRVAMELNPQQLGEDWPLLLDKICIRAFEE